MNIVVCLSCGCKITLRDFLAYHSHEEDGTAIYVCGLHRSGVYLTEIITKEGK